MTIDTQKTAHAHEKLKSGPEGFYIEHSCSCPSCAACRGSLKPIDTQKTADAAREAFGIIIGEASQFHADIARAYFQAGWQAAIAHERQLVKAAEELINNAAPDGYRNALCNQRRFYDDLRLALAKYQAARGM
jgi:hypothetical protein